MEDAMLSIRIVAAGAAFLVFLLMAVGGAHAQTAATAAPGKPISLLQILTQPDKTKTKLHAKRMSRPAGKTHIAAAKGKPVRPMQAAAAAAPEAADAAPVEIAAAEPVADVAPAFTDPMPSEVTIAGQSVQVVSPDEVNEIDLAANDMEAAAGRAAPNHPNHIGEAAPQSVLVKAAPPQGDARQFGDGSWIAQLLAALGGAIAAGSVAWFLIGPAPQRVYG
jgi:hypothetical protein